MVSNRSVTRWSSAQVSGGSHLNGWGVAGIVGGLFLAGAVAVTLPDLLRYRRIRRM